MTITHLYLYVDRVFTFELFNNVLFTGSFLSSDLCFTDNSELFHDFHFIMVKIMPLLNKSPCKTGFRTSFLLILSFFGSCILNL
jgi:hypothetical protein